MYKRCLFAYNMPPQCHVSSLHLYSQVVFLSSLFFSLSCSLCVRRVIDGSPMELQVKSWHTSVVTRVIAPLPLDVTEHSHFSRQLRVGGRKKCRSERKSASWRHAGKRPTAQTRISEICKVAKTMAEDVGWRLVAQRFRLRATEEKNSNPSIAKLALLGSYKKKKISLTLNCAVCSWPLSPTGMSEDYLSCRYIFTRLQNRDSQTFWPQVGILDFLRPEH